MLEDQFNFPLHIAQLEKYDPKAVRRAAIVFDCMNYGQKYNDLFVQPEPRQTRPISLAIALKTLKEKTSEVCLLRVPRDVLCMGRGCEALH